MPSGISTASASGSGAATTVRMPSVVATSVRTTVRITPEIARAKANAAAAFRTTTLDMETRFSQGRQLFASTVASLGDYQLVFGRGGVPLLDDGRVVGAVGVSGAVPADNDHAIAEAAAGG